MIHLHTVPDIINVLKGKDREIAQGFASKADCGRNQLLTLHLVTNASFAINALNLHNKFVPQ